jgi:hypothetical protein
VLEVARRARRSTVAAGGAYVVLVWIWLAENFRLLPGPRFLEHNLGGALVNVVAPALAGLLIRRWWVVFLPFTSLVLAVPLQIAGADGRGFDPLPPVAAVMVITLLFGVPAAGVGTAIGKLVERALGSTARRGRTRSPSTGGRPARPAETDPGPR